MDALENLKVKTFYGEIGFEKSKESQFYHANVGLTPLTIQIQNGKVVVVGPESLAEAKPAYPMQSVKK